MPKYKIEFEGKKEINDLKKRIDKTKTVLEDIVDMLNDLGGKLDEAEEVEEEEEKEKEEE